MNEISSAVHVIIFTNSLKLVYVACGFWSLPTEYFQEFPMIRLSATFAVVFSHLWVCSYPLLTYLMKLSSCGSTLQARSFLPQGWRQRESHFTLRSSILAHNVGCFSIKAFISNYNKGYWRNTYAYLIHMQILNKGDGTVLHNRKPTQNSCALTLHMHTFHALLPFFTLNQKPKQNQNPSLYVHCLPNVFSPWYINNFPDNLPEPRFCNCNGLVTLVWILCIFAFPEQAWNFEFIRWQVVELLQNFHSCLDYHCLLNVCLPLSQLVALVTRSLWAYFACTRCIKSPDYLTFSYPTFNFVWHMSELSILQAVNSACNGMYHTPPPHSFYILCAQLWLTDILLFRHWHREKEEGSEANTY